MADSKLQREYTLDDALADEFTAGKEGDYALSSRAESWIRDHVTDLETKVGYLEHLLTARMRNESARRGQPVSTEPVERYRGDRYDLVAFLSWLKDQVECTRPGRELVWAEFDEAIDLAKMMAEVNESVRAAFQRCDVSVPKQCVLQLGHGGHSHVSNSGTMWPVDDRRAFAGTAGEVRE